MCRWIAYSGTPKFLSSLVSEPEHSLIDQSLNASEAKTVTNGDGFGLGWYGEHAEPGLYREVLPAWSDENLKHLVRQIRSPMFFAHVRASTGTATTRANCHPFAHGPWLFMHNGQIGGYGRVRRKLEALVPDDLYAARSGSTDSELMFLLALSLGAADDTVGAFGRMLGLVMDLMREADITEPLRFTATLADGKTLTAFRFSSDERAPTLYFKCARDGATVVSEPLDRERDSWSGVPHNHVLVCRHGERCQVSAFEVPTPLHRAA